MAADLLVRPVRPASRPSALAVRLFRPRHFPDRIAVTKTGQSVEGGTFFLDFTRPIRIRRRFGRVQREVGLLVDLLVPVIHESEEHGTRTIRVYRQDPHFDDLCALWKAHYPSEDVPPTGRADRLDLLADFAAQFPTDR